MLSINDNTIRLEKYRGAIKRCPHCTPERILNDPLGRGCNTCLGHGFVAVCTNCAGTGIYKGNAIAFGGGDVPHQSACNPCGASGFFAVRKPANWDDNASEAAASKEVVASLPAAV
jgi:hypothetical protein